MTKPEREDRVSCPPIYMRPEDAARHVGVSRRQLELWAEEKKIAQPSKIGARITLYHRETLEADITRLCGRATPVEGD